MVIWYVPMGDFFLSCNNINAFHNNISVSIDVRCVEFMKIYVLWLYGMYLRYIFFFLVPYASRSASHCRCFQFSKQSRLAVAPLLLVKPLSYGFYVETMDNVHHGLYHRHWSSGTLCGVKLLFATSWATPDTICLLLFDLGVELR